MIQLSPSLLRQNTGEATMQVNLVPLAPNFAFGVGACAVITILNSSMQLPTLNFLVLEVQVPMGTCQGQYGIFLHVNALH